MPALILDNCCFCIELRTGSLIIGYLNLIANIVMIILGIVGLAAAAVFVNDSDPKYHDAGVVAMVVLAITVIVMILLMGFIIALLVGIHKNKRGHVKAYLIFSLVCIIIYIIMFLTSFGGATSAGVIVRQLVNIALSIYFLLVIRSYYYKMDGAAAPSYNTA